MIMTIWWWRWQYDDDDDDGEDYYDDDDDWDGFGAKFHQFPILQYSYNQQQRKARVSEVWSSIMYKYNASRAETRSQDPERKYPVSWNQSPHFTNDEQFIYVKNEDEANLSDTIAAILPVSDSIAISTLVSFCPWRKEKHYTCPSAILHVLYTLVVVIITVVLLCWMFLNNMSCYLNKPFCIFGIYFSKCYRPLGTWSALWS